ncbi:hypothetical protein Q5P01_003632 [Channa striata]|uniref:Uncharacterized protein n=1 Tax=Channa striata TaxID=64152 RepID=A0AA88NI14_CHASR|nr:hypothetical protein Q5P01_003632 [Channa striata]
MNAKCAALEIGRSFAGTKDCVEARCVSGFDQRTFGADSTHRCPLERGIDSLPQLAHPQGVDHDAHEQKSWTCRCEDLWGKGQGGQSPTRLKEFTQAAVRSPNRKDDSVCTVSQTNPRIVH